ncbi:hypothetical protein VKT23_019482 [Stygiomarasmius scandens]|uniref:F-box domain-containing protein n=1 Tax=Marasmiellus scandens TaxID=2682957 RepID=A0ABR1INI1_9AGAR
MDFTEQFQVESLVGPVLHRFTQEVNDAPNDAEALILREVIDVVTRETIVLDSQLSELDFQLAQLKARTQHVLTKRAQLVQIIQGARGGLSLIRSLPSEIILEVANHFVEEWQATDPAGPLWVMGRVCRKWRQILLNAPWLWKNVFVHVNQDIELEMGSALLKTWLDRSKRCSLRVRLTSQVDKRSDQTLQELVTELLVEQCDRWETASFRMANESERCSQVFSKAKGHLPLLKHIELENYRGPADVFEIAPKLASATFCKSRKSQNLILPWSQIEQFTTDARCFESGLLDCLNRLSMLTELSISGRESSSLIDSLSIQPELAFPHLRKLSVTSLPRLSPSAVRHGLLCSTAPANLECAEINHVDLLKFLRPSHHSLRSLTLNQVPMTGKCFRALKLLPLLDDLVVCGIYYLSEQRVDNLKRVFSTYFQIFDELSAREHDTKCPLLLPNLTKLTISHTGRIRTDDSGGMRDLVPDDFPRSRISNMLSTRHGVSANLGARQLKSFFLRMNIRENRVPIRDEGFQDEIQLLRQEGMQINFEFVEFPAVGHGGSTRTSVY